MFGMPSTILTGIDYYDYGYRSRITAMSPARIPIHVYDLVATRRLAAYWQQTVGLLPTTDFSYGAPDSAAPA